MAMRPVIVAKDYLRALTMGRLTVTTFDGSSRSLR